MKKNLLIPFLLMALYACNPEKQNFIDLSGDWQFQMDPDDLGITEKWFESNLPGSISLPGSMAESGLGNEVSMETEWTGSIMNSDWHNDPNYSNYQKPDDFRFPFWLQPTKEYTGAAWYNKKVHIPENQANQKVWLNLERPHWETMVWVNGIEIGMQNSLATPHYYDISDYIRGGENNLSIRVDNRVKAVDPGVNSHSISDHTQSNWNGIVGEIGMQTTGKIFFNDIRIFPNVRTKEVSVLASLVNEMEEKVSVKIIASARLKNTGSKVKATLFEFTAEPGENTFEMIYALGEDALLWDEFNPNVYSLTLELKSKENKDQKTTDFGLREFKREGNRFAINGRPVYLRGTLECAIFPKTGYPPTRAEDWKKIYAAVKAHGLNHVRFHSWCPPAAAFTAADEMGVYLQVECSSWANFSTQLGSGFPIDDYIWEESKKIVKYYGNHPSFVMLAYGNEPGGPSYEDFLTDFVSYWKENDNRRIYTGGAGWPELAVNDFHNIPQPRIQGWGEELNSIINAESPKTNYDWTHKLPGDGIPVVSHEIGQWCVYPNFREMEKYTGVLKPRNFEIFQESLEANHMGHLADSFLLASGKLQVLCYKADIEAAMRTPGLAGFQLLDLHDFPGQGTALVGVLDPFWEEKGYVTPQEYSRFCNSTVPLARLSKQIFREGEILLADIEIAHFGDHPLKDVNPKWEISEGSETIASGYLGPQDIAIGNGISLGKVEHQLELKNYPRKLVLEVSVNEFSNSWDLWVYPGSQFEKNKDVLIAGSLDASTIEHVSNGGKVLLSLGKGKVAGEMGGKVGVGFSSIFWNTAWTSGQKPHTLGILCNPEHPALELFPTEYHSNWQWQDAMSHSDVIILNDFPVELKPIVQVIDDWVSNRKLALIFEARVGEGKVLVSGVDLMNDLENRPEALQLKTSLVSYMESFEFNPGVQIKTTDLLKILK